MKIALTPQIIPIPLNTPNTPIHPKAQTSPITLIPLKASDFSDYSDSSDLMNSSALAMESSFPTSMSWSVGLKSA